MFHSLIHLCEVKRVWIALDESVVLCRAVNGCEQCPIGELFAAADDEHGCHVERSEIAASERLAA